MPQNTSLPTVVIVGRPNVGKSSLFNAILRKRLSIVHEQCGVTRDCVAAPAEYRQKRFLLVDTGGLGTLNRTKNVDLFDGMIREQVEEVVKDATLLVWVVNCEHGITPQDQEVSAFLHKTGKPLVLVANKADNAELVANAPAQFARLGFQRIFPVSCTHSSGLDDFLRAITADFAANETTGAGENGEAAAPAEPKPLRIAVVGRPNVGKSSIVNRLVGEERMMVSDIAGTTRDAVDLPLDIEMDGETLPIVLVDTAGLRRKGQISSVVEFFSANRTEQAIRNSDLVLFVLDTQDVCTTQERRIGRIIVDACKPCIMLANKWDIITKAGIDKPQLLIDHVRENMPYLNHAPILNVSAASGYNFRKIFQLIRMVKSQMEIMVPTGVFNQFLNDATQRNPPTSTGLKRFKIYYGTMTHNPPPKFVLFVNSKKICPKNYLAYLENQLRQAFFPEAGLPIMLELRERERDPQERNGGRGSAGNGAPHPTAHPRRTKRG